MGLKLTDKKRIAIVEAAVREFQRKGFEHTSMDKIAAEAGVSKRTVYNHFASKELLFDEILRQIWSRVDEVVDYTYKPEVPVEKQLGAILTAKLKLHSNTEYLNLIRAVLAEMIHKPERAQAMLTKLQEKEQKLTQWMEAAQAHGHIQYEDLQLAASLLTSLVNEIGFWPQLTIGRETLSVTRAKEVVQEAINVFLLRYGTS